MKKLYYRSKPHIIPRINNPC